MKKKIWDIVPGDIVLLSGKRYRWLKDVNKRMPGFGVVPNRILVNVDDPKDISQWFRNFEVDLVEVQEDNTK